MSKSGSKSKQKSKRKTQHKIPYGRIDRRDRILRWMIVHFLFVALSVSLSAKINNGFNFGSLFVAFFMPYIYIPYAIATHGFDIIWKDSVHKEEEDNSTT